jgi:hypothetical protein
MIYNQQTTINIISICGLLVALILFSVRAYGMFSFYEPLQAQARGAEFESLFVIWKYINGQPIYQDPTHIPYTLSAYNWLFYVIYGEIAGTILSLLSLDDAWLPTVCHAITVAFGAIGASVMYSLIVEISKAKYFSHRIMTAVAAVFFFFGPLPGYWTFAPAPDFLALIFSMLTLWVFFRGYARRPLFTTLCICVLVYMTWALKQNYLYVPAAIGFSFLLRRRWRDALLLAVLPFATIALTGWVGGPEYYSQLQLGNYVVLVMTLEEWWKNFFNFSIKLLPYLALLFGAAASHIFTRENLSIRMAVTEKPELMVIFIGLGVAISEAFITGAFVGAGENHYFMFGVFVVISAIVIYEKAQPNTRIKKLLAISFALGWALNILAVGTVLAGWQGSLSVMYMHEKRIQRQRCLAGLSSSIFVDGSHMMLPWMVPAKDHFVLSYSYLSDHAAGLEKEEGGVGGLMNKGYFDQIAILKWRGRQFDGSDLSLYPYLIRSCAGLAVYSQRPLSEN